jgi:hypothetical protein
MNKIELTIIRAAINSGAVHTHTCAKLPFEVSFWSSLSEENLQWKEFDVAVIDSGSLKLNVK